MSENPYKLNIEQIRKFLPHRQPFLLVDRVLEIHPGGSLDDTSPGGKVGTRVVATKCVSYNEPFFQGHFPDFAILPGVLQIEIMAQAASFSVYPYLMREGRSPQAFQCVLIGVDSARFRKPVIPGDLIRIETVVTKCRGRLWAFDGSMSVDGQKVAEASILANLVQNGESL